MATDEALVVDLATGSEPALRELLQRYERPLSNFIYRHTDGRDVEDLFQETWLRVVRHASRFDRSKRFSTWLFQIAINLCRDWHRRAPEEPRSAPDQVAELLDSPKGTVKSRLHQGLARLVALTKADRS